MLQIVETAQMLIHALIVLQTLLLLLQIDAHLSAILITVKFVIQAQRAWFAKIASRHLLIKNHVSAQKLL